jgi:hypothetical protein
MNHRKNYAKNINHVFKAPKAGMHRISCRIIRPFLVFGTGIRPDTGFYGRISGKAGYRISG